MAEAMPFPVVLGPSHPGPRLRLGPALADPGRAGNLRGLKPAAVAELYGTAEAAPFHGAFDGIARASIGKNSSLKGKRHIHF
jgi:hypothetical protein